MIIVRVELHSARTGTKTELARMEICNDESGTLERRNYKVRSLRGRCANALDKRVTQRQGKVEGFPSEQVHIWNLIATALSAMGYGRKGAADMETT